METTKVGGEVRKLHIIYFLSRMGRIEHPHLIRVHHLNRNGVYLRDVKRWLADLRGKDMPDAFAWSYKRRYKIGYVWQDLLDDDLITPISDNEYVLKGSEIMPITAFGPCTYGEKEATKLKGEQPIEVEDQQQHQQQQHSPKEECQRDPDPKIDTTTKVSSEIFEESPMFGSERSTLTDDSMKHEEEANKQHCNDETEKIDNYYSSSSFYSTLLNKKNKKTNQKNSSNNNLGKNGTPGSSCSSSSSSKSSYTKSKSYSSGASHMFRNLLSCGAVDTNDNVLVMLNRNKTASNKPINKPENKADDICKAENMGGSARVFGTSWNQLQQQQQHSARESFDGMKGSKKKQNEFPCPRPISAAYKPVNGPTCSQCGKSFKPEKLNTHMKSCKGMKAKGMKALAKNSAASVEKPPSQRSVNSSHKESTSGYFLTN